MNYTSILQIFEHQHECERKGEQITVRPDCDNGTYFSRRPMCIEMGVELNLVHTDKFPVPVPEDSEKGDN